MELAMSSAKIVSDRNYKTNIITAYYLEEDTIA